jgi:hypothetical protein
MKAAKLKEVGTNVVTHTYIEDDVNLGQIIFHLGYIWEVVRIEKPIN